jgi:hypothetical protein
MAQCMRHAPLDIFTPSCLEMHGEYILTVALVCREVNNQTLFLYSDDMQNSETERPVCNLIFNTNASFCPPHTKWINSSSVTYHPHSNECGLRTLLALSIMMTHPAPDATIILPYMHKNLSNIARSWVANSLLITMDKLPTLTSDITTLLVSV